MIFIFLFFCLLQKQNWPGDVKCVPWCLTVHKKKRSKPSNSRCMTVADAACYGGDEGKGEHWKGQTQCSIPKNTTLLISIALPFSLDQRRTNGKLYIFLISALCDSLLTADTTPILSMEGQRYVKWTHLCLLKKKTFLSQTGLDIMPWCGTLTSWGCKPTMSTADRC